MLVLGLLMIFTVLKFGSTMFGTELYPVTLRMLSTLEGGLSLFLIIITTFYAGELVWRERGLRVAEATDAYALPDWIPLASKMTALAGPVVAFLLAGALFTAGWQPGHGYTAFEPLLYLKGLALAAIPFVLMAALAVFLQAVSGNKFIGYPVSYTHLDVYKRQIQQHAVLSSRLVAGQPVVHVLADADPGEGFAAVPANLEDVYFGELRKVALADAAAQAA